MVTGDEESAWSEVQLPAPEMTRVAEIRGVNPVRTFVTEFDTSETVPRAAFMEFLQNPIPVLTGQLTKEQQVDGAVVELLNRLVVDGIRDDWKVVTVLRNHHRALFPRIMFALATVSEEEKTLYLDAYKQRE